MTNPAPNALEREALKPCPFCGGEAEIERKGAARQSMIVVCTECGARVESGDVVGFTRPERYAWNRRPSPDLAGGGDKGVMEQLREAMRELDERWPILSSRDPVAGAIDDVIDALEAALSQPEPDRQGAFPGSRDT